MTMPTITRTWTGSVVLTFPYAAELVEALKDEIPVHARRYDPAVKAWTVSAAYSHVAARLMFEVFPDVEIVEQPRPGSSDRGPRAGDDPWRILHLRPTAPPELVTAAHKCLAKLNHPDRGGSTATMQRINAAVDRIREAS